MGNVAADQAKADCSVRGGFRKTDGVEDR